MHLAWGEAEEAFRAELLAFLDEHAPPEARVRRDFAGDVRSGGDGSLIPQWARDWQATLFDHGWMIPGYPPELGGRNATPVQTLVYLEEMARLGVPRSVHFPGYAIVAPTLLEFGTPSQRALAPAAIRGDTVWCIGMSEPNAGSDLAGLQTRAELDGDNFVINGQKVWTSYAMDAQLCCCYVRTDPDAAKHKGISLLIVDMSTPGIEVRPLRHLTGAADFAEVFFTDAVVPRSNLVGDLHDGWRLTQGSLAHERAGLWVESVARLEQSITGLIELARKVGVADDPVIRRRIGEVAQRAATPAFARVQGIHIVRAGILSTGALVPEARVVGAGQGPVRARHGDPGAVRTGDRRAAQPGSRSVGARDVRELREHDRRRLERDPAQHHRPAGPRTSPRMKDGLWTSR